MFAIFKKTMVPMLILLFFSCGQNNPNKATSEEKMEDVMESQQEGMEKAKEWAGTEGEEMGADSLEVNDSIARDSLPKSDLDSLNNQ